MNYSPAKLNRASIDTPKAWKGYISSVWVKIVFSKWAFLGCFCLFNLWLYYQHYDYYYYYTFLFYLLYIRYFSNWKFWKKTSCIHYSWFIQTFQLIDAISCISTFKVSVSQITKQNKVIYVVTYYENLQYIGDNLQVCLILSICALCQSQMLLCVSVQSKCQIERSESNAQWAVGLSVQTQTVAMQIHVSNNCQVAPGELLIRVWDVFSSCKQSREQQRANSGKSRCKKRCSGWLAGLLPSSLFTLATCVHVCVCVFALHAYILKDGVTIQDVYLSECTD